MATQKSPGRVPWRVRVAAARSMAGSRRGYAMEKAAGAAPTTGGGVEIHRVKIWGRDPFVPCHAGQIRRCRRFAFAPLRRATGLLLLTLLTSPRRRGGSLRDMPDGVWVDDGEEGTTTRRVSGAETRGGMRLDAGEGLRRITNGDRTAQRSNPFGNRTIHPLDPLDWR